MIIFLFYCSIIKNLKTTVPDYDESNPAFSMLNDYHHCVSSTGFMETMHPTLANFYKMM